MKKKGNFTTNEIVGLVLGAVAVFVLLWLLSSLVYSSFVREKEISETYFNFFNDAVSIADKGGTGYFGTWQEEKGARYYLVYFGSGIEYKYGGLVFQSIGENVNHVCVCYAKVGGSTTNCEYCENLKYPIRFDGREGNFTVVVDKDDGYSLIKTKTENFYRMDIK